MPIIIRNDTFFKFGYGFKYITGWDRLFRRESFSGNLKFYDGNPTCIVDVEINADRNRLKEEDIIITVGEHNLSNIELMIKDKTNLIYEMCKSSITMAFTLDLVEMKVITSGDFKELFPKRGLHTFFVFENVPNKIFCFMNPARDIKDSEFLCWFISYIYSGYICLTPNNKIEDYALKFLQAISGYASSGGKKTVITNNVSILKACAINDMGELLLPIPGNRTGRLEHLFESSIEQMSSNKNKESKREGKVKSKKKGRRK